MNKTVISRKDAKAAGLKRYYTGKPCIHGHDCERQSSWGRCIQCNRDNVSRIYASPKGKLNWKPRNEKWRVSAKGRAAKKKSDANQYLIKPDEYKERARQRRARKFNAEGTHTAADIAALRQRQSNCLCGVSFDGIKSTIDHVVPLSRGGSDWPENLQLLCGPCNDSKGVKLMCEWVSPTRRAA